MLNKKLHSFTLAELLIVMVLTAIVVGLAFSILRLVQKEIIGFQKHLDNQVALALFEQKLWQDFSKHPHIEYHAAEQLLFMVSETDTTRYFFGESLLRNTDTIQPKLLLQKLFFQGKEVSGGPVDAISLSGETNLPNHNVFVSKRNDVTFFMNTNGF